MKWISQEKISISGVRKNNSVFPLNSFSFPTHSFLYYYFLSIKSLILMVLSPKQDLRHLVSQVNVSWFNFFIYLFLIFPLENMTKILSNTVNLNFKDAHCKKNTKINKYFRSYFYYFLKLRFNSMCSLLFHWVLVNFTNNYDVCQ